MANPIDPREVLSYLNELGYTNISAVQLKDFIKDLKKVIKYDRRYGPTPEDMTSLSEDEHNEDRRNNSPQTTSINANPSSSIISKCSTIEDVRKPQHIAVHIFDKKRKLSHEHCVHMEPNKENNPADNVVASQISTQSTSKCTCKSTSSCTCRSRATSKDKKSKVTCVCKFGKLSHEHCIHMEQNKENNPTDNVVTSQLTTQSTLKCTCSTSNTRSRATSKDRKSKVTFIRPAICKPSVNRCDPVALYHFYQSVWKRSKIPGEDKRDDLRWAIREKMLSGPKVEVNFRRCSSKSINSLGR